MPQDQAIKSVSTLSAALRGECSKILLSGWGICMFANIIKHPYFVLIGLPMSSALGAFIACIGFPIALIGIYGLMLFGLFWLNGETLHLWPMFLSFVKFGVILPPIALAVYFLCLFIALLWHGGGIKAIRAIRAMSLKDLPNDQVVLECP